MNRVTFAILLSVLIAGCATEYEPVVDASLATGAQSVEVTPEAMAALSPGGGAKPSSVCTGGPRCFPNICTIIDATTGDFECHSRGNQNQRCSVVCGGDLNAYCPDIGIVPLTCIEHCRATFLVWGDIVGDNRCEFDCNQNASDPCMTTTITTDCGGGICDPTNGGEP